MHQEEEHMEEDNQVQYEEDLEDTGTAQTSFITFKWS